jgi:hypothetical protein
MVYPITMYRKLSIWQAQTIGRLGVWRVKKMLIAMGLLALASPALGMNYRTQTVPQLLKRWVIVNGDCRGGRGYRACDELRLVESALETAQAVQQFNGSVVASFEAGVIDQMTALREMRKFGDTIGAGSAISDQSIIEAENSPPLISPEELKAEAMMVQAQAKAEAVP